MTDNFKKYNRDEVKRDFDYLTKFQNALTYF